MTKTLKVIKPFAMMDAGDTFELSENGNYISSYSEEYNTNTADSDDFHASYSGSYEISPAYADQLIADGYLSVDEKTTQFVNVFDEINDLLAVYTADLNNLAAEAEGMPACMKVEKETVLRNMIKVLDHLNSLKK